MRRRGPRALRAPCRASGPGRGRAGNAAGDPTAAWRRGTEGRERLDPRKDQVPSLKIYIYTYTPRSPGPRSAAYAKSGEGSSGAKRMRLSLHGDYLLGRNAGWVPGGRWAQSRPPKECERLGLRLPVVSPFSRPQQSSGGKLKDREQHEGEKNGRRGLRNPQALPTLRSLCGAGVPHHSLFSFSQPPALRNRYLGVDLQIVRGRRTLQEKLAEQDQKLGV